MRKIVHTECAERARHHNDKRRLMTIRQYNLLIYNDVYFGTLTAS